MYSAKCVNESIINSHMKSGKAIADCSCLFAWLKIGGVNMSKSWWKYAGIRALKTICQTAIATIGTSVVLSDVNWLAVLSASVLAGILSMLTSLAGLPEVEKHD